MSEEKKLALPGNGYDVIAKILQAYVLSGGGEKALSLDAVASRGGIHPTQVSRNTGFLVSIGLLTGGKSKALTPEGARLAIALRNRVEEDVSAEWKRVCLNTPSLRSILDMISIREEVDKDALPGRIASTLGIASSDNARAGINALIEIFKKAEVLEETDGNYRLTPTALADVDAGTAPNAGARGVASGSIAGIATAGRPSNTGGSGSGAAHAPGVNASSQPNLSIHVHISVDSSPEQIDAVFSSIAKHLYGKETANDSSAEDELDDQIPEPSTETEIGEDNG